MSVAVAVAPCVGETRTVRAGCRASNVAGKRVADGDAHADTNRQTNPMAKRAARDTLVHILSRGTAPSFTLILLPASIGMKEQNESVKCDEPRMGKSLKFQKLLTSVRQALDGLPEHRSEENTRYTLTEAGLSAFAVFYTQSPSFLAHQRDMQRQRGQHNVQSGYPVIVSCGIYWVQWIQRGSGRRFGRSMRAGRRGALRRLYRRGQHTPDLAGGVTILQFRKRALLELSCDTAG